MSKRLQNKVALLAGAGPSMGRATAWLFAQEGARVAVAARRETQLQETTLRIIADGGDASNVVGDVSVRADADRIVESVVERYGRIDVLYSAAGGFFAPDRDFASLDEASWKSAVGNTIDSLYNLAKAVQPVMKQQGGGAIVSVAASDSVRLEGNAAYGAAKAGVIGLAQSLAREFYSDNIRVNTVASGLIRGPLGEGEIVPAAASLGRIGYPEDIAHAALFLACDESAWITGQMISVDGGVDVGARPLWEFERPSN